MSAEFDPIRILRELRDYRVAFVLIGGYAASLHGSPLMTGDLDICYARDLANVERLVEVLRSLHATLRGADEGTPFHLDARSLRNGDSFTFETEAGAFDVLGTPSGTGGFDDLDADAIEAKIEDGLVIRVSSLDDLMRMKRASGRAKDRISLEFLIAIRDELEAGGRS